MDWVSSLAWPGVNSTNIAPPTASTKRFHCRSASGAAPAPTATASATPDAATGATGTTEAEGTTAQGANKRGRDTDDAAEEDAKRSKKGGQKD